MSGNVIQTQDFFTQNRPQVKPSVRHRHRYSRRFRYQEPFKPPNTYSIVWCSRPSPVPLQTSRIVQNLDSKDLLLTVQTNTDHIHSPLAKKKNIERQQFILK